MPDEPTTDQQDQLPENFVVRLELNGKVHFIFCQSVVAFDQSRIFASGAKALHDLFVGFRLEGIAAEVAVLPDLGDPAWMLQQATIQLGDGDGGGG